MISENSLSINKPTPVLKKSIKVNFQDFSKALGKGFVDLSFGKWDSLAGHGVEALSALGLAIDVGEIGWLLVYRSLALAMKTLVNEKTELSPENFDVDSLQTQINHTLETSSLSLNKKFFDYPDRDSIVKEIRPTFAEWLKQCGLSEADAQATSDRLPIYFASALHEEWGRHPQNYLVLKERLNTPFTQANEISQAWMRYATWLQKQVEEPVFLESFSLKRVYVPLRAYYKLTAEGQKPEEVEGRLNGDRRSERVVVELEKELETWLDKALKTDAIRLISGGPGSGKSSFSKMFAARLAERGTIPVLFIPLHHFDPSEDLIDAVGKFVQMDGILPHNPLASEQRGSRLLIIFDGLDELAMQGKIAENAAQGFVREIQRKVERFNQRETCLQVLISGRELVVQANEIDFRKDGQILHVLPYYVPECDHNKYTDLKKLLRQDQRQLWWQNYGAASGSRYTGLPTELDQGNLIEITAQPLLNYLVALSFRRGRLKFSVGTNLNAVYADLIKAIYERGWAEHQHTAIQGIKEEDFARILEEIALAAWHGNGRTTTVQAIEDHRGTSNLKKLLDRFELGYHQDSRTGITRLMIAFYFRQSEHHSSDEKAFEFSHKSFGEYLVARRIVQEVNYVHKKLTHRHISDLDGWDERCSLHRWAVVCGASAIDEYLLSFIFDELRLVFQRHSSEVAAWQQTLCHLISYILLHGMPMERLYPRPDFQNEDEQARNAEGALLAVLNSCARLVNKPSRIIEPTEGALGAWISRLNKQRLGGARSLVRECLSFMDLSNCQLAGIDLSNSNLQHCILDKTNLSYALLMGANLQYAHISHADLFGANISNASFENAQIEKMILKQAIVEGVSWEKTTMKEVNLDEAIGYGLILDTTDLVHVLGVDEIKRQVQEELKTCTEISEICKTAVKHAKFRLQCQVAFIYLLDKDGYLARSAINGVDKDDSMIEDDWLYEHTWGHGQGKPEHYSPDQGLTGRGFPSTGTDEGYGYVQHADNFEREYFTEQKYKYGKQYKIRLGELLSGISVKIAGSSRPYGAIDVISKKGDRNALTRFTKDDYYLLDSIARLVSAHISRIRKGARERIMDILIDGLYSIDYLEIEALYLTCQNLVNCLTADSFPFKVCIIRGYHKLSGFYNIAKSPNVTNKESSISWDRRSHGQPEIDPPHITKTVIDAQEPIFRKDLKDDLKQRKYRFHNPDWILMNHLAALAIYPLIANHEVVGTISIYTGYTYWFSVEDQDFLRNVSRLLSFFVHQCNLKKERLSAGGLMQNTNP
jgi:uncharacterized protein YjbI with pentapeptide repeats/GAF domain-containing protein